MHAHTFLEETIRPVLKAMFLWSPAAEKLLLMTACHESQGFRHRKQLGGGPAVSWYQIEPATLTCLYTNYLSYRPEKKELVYAHWPAGMNRLQALERDDAFATAVARMIYYRAPHPLPDVDDEEGLARYCKVHWNTHKGKATAEKYLADYHRYKPEGYG